MTQIIHRYTLVVLFTAPNATTLGEAVKEAIQAKADLEGANLYGANLEGANLRSANLEGANLEGANLYGANLEGADLYGANLEGANLRSANLEGANLYGANLEGADLYGANLEGADLYGANLRSANLEGANLYGANLEGADLYGANLYGANLEGANLRSANLEGANLYGANLEGADLYGANLYGANLEGADLRSANLEGANLYGADLYGADLYGANLEPIKADIFDVISKVPNEVPGLIVSLRIGRVDGSAYEGACACLVGTVANVKGCHYNAIEGLTPNADRPAERWFLGIQAGDTPATNQVARITEGWLLGWVKEHSPKAAEAIAADDAQVAVIAQLNAARLVAVSALPTAAEGQ